MRAPRSTTYVREQSRAGRIVVSADQLDAALDELLDTRNAMTRVLLGGEPGRAHR
jgi:hypothetical protein